MIGSVNPFVPMQRVDPLFLSDPALPALVRDGRKAGFLLEPRKGSSGKVIA